MPGSLIIRQPSIEEGRPATFVTGFEEAMDPLMGGMRIAWIAGQRALDQSSPRSDLSGFDIGPASIAEKPPIIAPERRQFLQQRQLCLVMVDPPAESEQPKNA